MKQCRNCGSQIDDFAIFCPNCGARTNGDTPNAGFYGDMYNSHRGENYDTGGSKLVAAVSFLFWQAGLILWLILRQSAPGKSRSALKGMLASFTFSIPLLGLAVWLIFKDDFRYKDFSKTAGISAIVGAAFNVAVIVIFAVLKALGIELLVDILPEMVDGLITSVILH